MKPDRQIGLLLAALDEAFDRRSWHGTNLLGSLRSVNAMHLTHLFAAGVDPASTAFQVDKSGAMSVNPAGELVVQVGSDFRLSPKLPSMDPAIRNPCPFS